MSRHSLLLRATSAAWLGLICAGACGAAMPEAGNEGPVGKSHWTADTSSPVGPAAPDGAEALARKHPRVDDAGAGGEVPNCPNGALEDPHRGFVRCLKPEERDAGWLPPPPQHEPPPAEDGGSETIPPDAGPPAAAPPPPPPKEPAGPPPLVAFNAPKFEGGEVPRAEKFLNGVLDGVGKCVAENGGLKGAKGSFKVTFLVRARGRAEGVEVASPKGLAPEAAACIRLLLKNRSVGAPTADPVGVTVTFTLERAQQ